MLPVYLSELARVKQYCRAAKLVQTPASVEVRSYIGNRLRGLVLRANQLQRALGEMGGAQGLMLDALRAELEGEPCVAEFPRL